MTNETAALATTFRRMCVLVLLAAIAACSSVRAGEEASENLDVIRRVISERGEYDLAERSLKTFIEKNAGRPAAAEALVLLGYCQDKQKKNEEAAASYARMLTEYPGAPAPLRGDAGLGAADAYFRLGRYAEAIANYTILLELGGRPEQAEAALLWRGEANYRLGLEAQDAGREGREHFVAAVGDFSLFMERYPESKLMASAVSGAAFACFDSGDYARALTFFERFSRDFPDDRRAEECRYFTGEALYRLNRFDEARNVYSQLAAANPRGPFAADARAGEAWADYSLGRIAEAAAGFEKAAELAGDDHERAVSFLYDAGCAWREAGDSQKAAAPLLEVAKANDHELNGLAWFRLGTLWQEQARTARQRAEAAVNATEKSRFVELQKKLGGDAIQYFKRALSVGRLGDEEIEARSLLGEVLLDAGEYAEASDVFGEIAERWSDSERAPWALYHRALAERELSLAASDQAKAREHLVSAAAALRKSLGYPDAKTRLQAAWALADYLTTLGDTDAAREQYRWLAAEGPDWARNWRGSDGRADPAQEARAREYAADSLFRLGESYYFASDYTRSAGFYQEIGDKYADSPQSAMAMLRRGEIAEHGKDLASARARYEQALKLGLHFGKLKVGSTIGYAQLRLGTLLLREGQKERVDDMRRRMLQEAVRNLTAVLADPPEGLNPARPHYYLAEAKYSLGLTREAIADYEKSIAADAKGELSDAAWFGLAWARKDLGETAESLEAARKVIDDFPESAVRPDAYALAASIRRSRGDSAGALADLDRFLAEYADHQLAAKVELERASALDETGSHDEAATAFQKFLAAHADHPDVPQALYQRSWALWNRIRPKAKQAREAEARWRDLTGGLPADELPESLRGEAARAEKEMNDLSAAVRKDEDEILSALRDLTTRYPDYPVVDAAWLRIGEILYDRSDFQQALAAYQKALSASSARNSELADKAQYRMAWSIQRLAEASEKISLGDAPLQRREAARKDMWDKRVAAIDAFEAIIGRYPKSELVGDACFRAAELRRRSGQDNSEADKRSAWFKSAVQRYRQALEKGGEDAPYLQAAQYGEGLCLLLDDQSAEAREVFRRLLLKPDGPYVQEAYWGLGQANLNLGAYADAASAFEQALATDKTTETAAKSRYGLGMTAELSGDAAKARLEFLAVDALYPNYPDWAAAALVRAARTALQDGLRDKAIGDLERVLARYPDTPAAAEARDMQAAVASGGTL